MTDEELSAIREEVRQITAFIASHRAAFAGSVWWREDAIGITATKHATALLAEVERLRVEVKNAGVLRPDYSKLRVECESLRVPEGIDGDPCRYCGVENARGACPHCLFGDPSLRPLRRRGNWLRKIGLIQ